MMPRMAKRAVTRAVLSASINIRVKERLEAFAKAQGRSVSELVDRAVGDYLDRHDKPAKPAPAK